MNPDIQVNHLYSGEDIMSNRFTRKLVVLFFGALLSASFSAVQAETITFATWQGEASTSVHARTLHWFVDEVSKRTEGKHSVRVLWGGAGAAINEVASAVENGVMAAGDLVLPYHPDQFPLNNVVGFFWPQPLSPLEIGQLLEGFLGKYPAFADEMKRYKMKVLGFRPLDNYGFLCTSPIQKVEGFKGKRIRSYGVALPAVIESLGAVPVNLSTPETYEALERNIVDCAPIEAGLGRAWEYDTVAKNWIDVGLGASFGQMLIINQNVFDSLPADFQQVLVEVGAEYLKVFTDEQAKFRNEVIEEWGARDDFKIVDFPKDEFLAVTENDPGVKAVRQRWIDTANGLGVPAEEIAGQLMFDR
jgi:TRAP-type C4-dicarboxylate transport system substrate-binding protein